MTETELKETIARIASPDEAARAENVCRVVCGIPKWVKGGNGLGRA